MTVKEMLRNFGAVFLATLWLVLAFNGKARWYARQSLPLSYESKFKEDGKSILCQWRMWLGRCFRVRSWELAK